MRIKPFIILALLSCCHGICLAHGASYTLLRDTSVVIKVKYSDGTAMSYAEVKIFSPNDDEIEYQNGRTDKNGCFAFVPNEQGVWMIKVNDGMGHGINEQVTIKEGSNISGTDYGHSNKNQFIGAMGVILSAVGLLFYWKSKRK